MSATRRAFIGQSLAGSGGLFLAFHAPEVLAESLFAPAAPVPFEPNVFLRIDATDVITIAVTRQEMGQGVRTLLPMMLAEDLDADWTKVRLDQAIPGGKFKDVRLHTSGSGSSSTAFRTFRAAGAMAREMLIGAAAADWGVQKESCRTEKSRVIHTPTGRSRTYGQLTALAAKQPLPKEPRLKQPSEFKIIGQSVKRVDGPDIVTGRARFGLDVRVPGMLYASIERAPSFGSRLKSFDDAQARNVAGVRAVVPVTTGIHPGVAVVASDTWSALKGRAALKIEWDHAGRVAFDSDAYLAGLIETTSRASFKVRHEGDALTALAQSPRKLKGSYLFPFEAHACMEPMNATADVRADRAEFWLPTQTPLRSMQQAVKVTGLPEDKITIHSMLMGGGFGRRLFADFVAEAAEVSKAVKAPVQVLWTREDDLRHGYFQPATAEVFEAGLDEGGALKAFVHRTSASDLTIYDHHDGKSLWPRAASTRSPDGYARDETPWGAFDTPYVFENLRVDCADITSPVPVGPWRAVEYPSTVFGRECFLDELAHAASKDPIRFRLDLLPPGTFKTGEGDIDRGRLARSLEEVRRLSNWDAPFAKDERVRGRGVAANVYHAGSYIAMVAEVSLARDFSDLRVERIVAAIDCGIALNVLGVLGQAESGISWGLSATLLGKMNFKDGRAVQGSFADYQVLRIDQMPKTELHILNSTAAPDGFGEHPVPHVAPAVANAVFAATGRRVRELPITPELIRRS